MRCLAIIFVALLSTCASAGGSEKDQGEIDSLKRILTAAQMGRVDPRLGKAEQRLNENGAYTFAFPTRQAKEQYTAKVRDRLARSKQRISNRP
jgi:hypothetical protein